MKVIITIAAGRQISMTGLIPQLLAQEGWDEMHVWVHTKIETDLSFLYALPKLDSRIKLKFLNKNHKDGDQVVTSGNLGDWWPDHCTDPDAIYVRFDDDIVFVEKDTVKELVAARLKYPDPYLIFPVIINNAVLAHHLEVAGKIKNPQGVSYTPYVFDPLIWDADMCIDLHRQFLDKAEQSGVKHFHIDNMELTPQHISINCMAYFGKDIAKWGGKFGKNGEEGFITCQVPFWNNRNLMIMGSKVVSHMAFAPQRLHWEGSINQDDTQFVNQLGTLQKVEVDLVRKYATDAEFRQRVLDRIRYHNAHVEILDRYRKLHKKLYNITGFPISPAEWNWEKILQDPTEFDFSTYVLPSLTS